MHVYLPIAELSVNWFTLLVVGGGVGFLSGLFGVGGGFLTAPPPTPGVPAPVAVGTGAAQILASSVSGVLAHWRRQNVDVQMGIALTLGGFVGSALGTWIFTLLRQAGQVDLVIRLSFVLFLGSVGGLMLIEKRAHLVPPGGTGGFAVRVAELGHRVLVVDPSPDALAALDRRARERGVADRVVGQQGDLSACSTSPVPAAPTWCCATACSRSSTTRPRRWPRSPTVLRPGGVLSLLVAQRHAAVVARAMAGHFQQARACSTTRTPAAAPGRRFTREELAGLLAAAGLEPTAVHAVRVFADLVPGSLLDLEPGATAALVELEQAVAERPEYLPLATQVHVLAACADPPDRGQRGPGPVADRCSRDCPILHVDMDAFYASVALRDRPDLARRTRDRGRRVPRGGAVGQLPRPASGVRSGDADDPGPAVVPAGGGGRARLRHLRVGVVLGDGDLPAGHAAGGGALARRGLPRRPRLHPSARVAPRHRRAAARHDPRRAGHHLLGRGRGLGRRSPSSPVGGRSPTAWWS